MFRYTTKNKLWSLCLCFLISTSAWSHSMTPSKVDRSIGGRKVMQRFQVINPGTQPMRFYMEAVARDRSTKLETIQFLPKSILVQARGARSFNALIDLGDHKELEGFVCSYSGRPQDSVFENEGLQGGMQGQASIRTGACNSFRFNRVVRSGKQASDQESMVLEPEPTGVEIEDIQSVDVPPLPGQMNQEV
jgi:hypothetical protein